MFVRLEDEVEVNIYINGEVRENEEHGRGEESTSSRENFEDDDNEYEYKMSEELEEKSLENEEDDWVFQGDDEGLRFARDTDIEWFGDENIVCSGDELSSDKEFDGEGKKNTFPVFNPSCLFEPSFALGMVFSNKTKLRQTIQSHAITNKRNIKIAKYDKERLHAKCADKECMWRIHACVLKSECTFQIRDYVPNHTYNITFHVKNMKSTWLSKKYMHKFKTNRMWGIKGFKIDAIEEIRCNITRNQAVRAKRLALLMLEGSASEQYALLWDYADEIKRSNPGSTVILGTEQEGEENMLDRFYVCLQALKLNFLNGCRLVICVDGCHLKGAYGGVLLSIVSIDPNNNFFPICYAVVMKEHKDTWDWFLTLLKMEEKNGRIGRPRKTRRLEPDEPVQKKKRKPAPIFKEEFNKIKRQKTTVKCGKYSVEGHNARTCKEPVNAVMGRNEPVTESPNEPVAEAANIPQKLKVRRKGKEHVHEGDVVIHRKTRSGYIPPTSAFKLPPKTTTTAPTMFEQFKQCQKGVKIRELASFIDGERQNKE
ncbi:UNVERIFIED_CONTAM: hypothetical protein Sindi_1645200 [Sesamum indicum]